MGQHFGLSWGLHAALMMSKHKAMFVQHEFVNHIAGNCNATANCIRIAWATWAGAKLMQQPMA
eukprot:5883912-Alexandrium_andersonii.AAC.1